MRISFDSHQILRPSPAQESCEWKSQLISGLLIAFIFSLFLRTIFFFFRLYSHCWSRRVDQSLPLSPVLHALLHCTHCQQVLLDTVQPPSLRSPSSSRSNLHSSQSLPDVLLISSRHMPKPSQSHFPQFPSHFCHLWLLAHLLVSDSVQSSLSNLELQHLHFCHFHSFFLFLGYHHCFHAIHHRWPDTRLV